MPSQYAKFLRRFAEGFGIKRVEGKIKEVKQNATTGFIESLVLHSGATIEGDLFIDCTGFRGLIIEQTLKSGYEDWSHWLPCDSAAAVQTELTEAAPPYTRSIAHDSGWRWCIPLQHRVGNGLVFSSQFLADEAAKEELLNSIDGKPLTMPRVLKFQTGRRRQVWNKNCVALGLSSGFIEPLESTSIHLMMVGVTRLLHLFPFGGVHQAVVDQYNEAARIEMEKTRDFVVLHYHATQRDDTPFWRHCRDMPIPDSLAQRIELFRQTGLCVSGRQRTVPRRFMDPGHVGTAHQAEDLSSRRAIARRRRAHEVSGRVSRFDSADSRAHAGAPGIREPVLQGEQQRLELRRVESHDNRTASGLSTAEAQDRARAGAAAS